MPLPNQDLRRRYFTLQEAGLQPLTDGERESLNATLEEDLLEGLEIQLGPNRSVPRCNTYIPRIFIMKDNAEKKDTMMSPGGAQCPVGSPEFWEQVQLGNVFAFPKGKAEPVQLGIGFNQQNQPKLTATTGLQPDQIPKAPKKPMGFWRWAFRIVTGFLGYRGRRNQNLRVDRNHEDVVSNLRSKIKDRSQTLEQENREIEQRHFEKTRPERETNLQTAAASMQEKETGLSNHLSIFSTQPKLNDHIQKTDSKEGICTKEQFRNLTVFVKNPPQQQEKEFDKQGKELPPIRYEAFDRESIKIGPGKQTLTEEEFAAMGLFAAWQPEIQMKVFEASDHYDPTLKRSLERLGFPKDKIDLVITSQMRNFGTTDNFRDIGRDNEGQWFHLNVDPGRRMAAEAFRKYQAGDKAPLAKLIADGVNMASGVFNSFDSPEIGYNTYGTAIAAESMLKLMDKDPELRTLALKQGMDRKSLAVVKGSVKINELDTEARKAYKKLAEARLDGAQLSKEQKAEYAKTLVKSRMMTDQLRLYGKRAENAPEVRQWNENVIQPDMSMGGMFDQKPAYDQWPMPEEGKIHLSYYNEYLGGVKDTFSPPNQAAMKMAYPQKVEELDRIAEEVVRQNHMENWDLEDLYQELGSNPRGKLFKMSDSWQKAEENLGLNAQEDLQEGNQLEHENNLIINTGSRQSNRIHEEEPDGIQLGGA